MFNMPAKKKPAKKNPVTPDNSKIHEMTNRLFAKAPEKDDSELSAQDSAYMEAIKQNYSKEDIQLKSELNPKQVIAHTKLRLFASLFNNMCAGNLSQTHLELQVSKDRKGRKEMVQLSQQQYGTTDEKEPTLLTRLTGGSF